MNQIDIDKDEILKKINNDLSGILELNSKITNELDEIMNETLNSDLGLLNTNKD